MYENTQHDPTMDEALRMVDVFYPWRAPHSVNNAKTAEELIAIRDVMDPRHAPHKSTPFTWVPA